MSLERNRLVSDAWGAILMRDLVGCDIETEFWSTVERGPIKDVSQDYERKIIRIKRAWTARRTDNGGWTAFDDAEDLEFLAYLSEPDYEGELLTFDVPMGHSVKIFLNKEDRLDPSEVEGLELPN